MNNLIKPCAFTMMLLLHYGLQAQQFPVVSQYMQNHVFFNPGATGAGQHGHIQLLHRSQWAGYETYDDASGAAPQLQLLTAAIRLKSHRDSVDTTGKVVRTWVKTTRHGVGLVLMRDQAASLTTVDAKLSYAYHIPLSRYSTLALGVQGGLQSQSVDYAKFRVAHLNDPRLPSQGRETETRPALMFGLWYDHEKYYMGVAVDGVTKSTLDKLGIHSNRNWIVTAGYHFTVTSDWKVSPSIMALSNSEENLLAAGITAAYNNVFWGGLTYRHDEAASAMLGIGLLDQRRLYINYAIDYITGNSAAKANTSHEVMLGYRWK